MTEFSNVEKMALELLSEKKDGRGMICEPHLVSALNILARHESWVFSEFAYVNGSVFAGISDKGRAAVGGDQ